MGRRAASQRLVVALVAAGVVAGCGGADAPRSAVAARPSGRAVIRVDQVGYPAGDPKRAVLLSRVPASNVRFAVRRGSAVVLRGTGAALPRWSAAWPHAYRLDASAVRSPGTYTITVSGPVRAVSPPFRVDAPGALYGPLARAALGFLHLQRDPHAADARALEYATPRYRQGVLVGGLRQVGGPVDVSGGWMDAADTLKYAETASFTEVALLEALRDAPGGLGSSAGAARDEARYGLDWLLRLWDPQTKRLVYQVGLGDGNGHSILGAHDTRWRLPTADDKLAAPPGSPEHYVKYRPAFVMPAPLSPNLAGRMAAAYALGAQVLGTDDPALRTRALQAAESIFAAADTHPRKLVSSAPTDFYPEAEWRDDLELGAAALSRATAGTPASRSYLGLAARWADAYASSPLNGSDSLNLYDVAALAHDELAGDLRAAGLAQYPAPRVSARTMAVDLLGRQRVLAAHARRDPFGYGPYRDSDVVAHALGWTIEAPIIDQLSATAGLRELRTRQRDLVLGRNAWGVSFMTGAGTTFPRCLHHPVANLQRSLDGRGAVLSGAVVPGATSAADVNHLDRPSGARPCPASGGDPYRTFDARGARYVDNVAASATNEPSIDLAALAILAFSQAARG